MDLVVNSVGVPFLQRDTMGVYALNCVSPANLFTAEKMEREVGTALIALSQELYGHLSDSGVPAVGTARASRFRS